MYMPPVSFKLDNVVVGSGKVKPHIIDFGKACPIAKRKKYSLTKKRLMFTKKSLPLIFEMVSFSSPKQPIYIPWE